MGRTLVYGADAAFAFFQNVNVGGYWARAETSGLSRDTDSYQGKFDFTGD